MANGGMFIFHRVPGWRFFHEEVSTNRWRVTGLHDDGRSVSREGSDEKVVLAACIEDARGQPEHPEA